MKKCKTCDLSYEDDKKFCRKCGSKLETSSTNSPKELVKKEVYQDRLKTDPLNIELLYEYTQFLFDNSFFEETTTNSLKILEINKSDTFAKELLFKSYLKLKLYNEASKILEQLLAEKPNDIKYLEFQATILIELKNFDKAIECYDKILKLQPNNISTLNAKALTLLENNNIEEASAIFYKIFLENQDDKLTTVYVGIYYTLKEDYETAKNILIPILTEKDSPIPKIHKSRGILYLAFSLCHLNADMSEIKTWFNVIDFKILSTYYPNNDEKTLVQTFSRITNNELNTLKTANIDIELLNFKIDSSIFCFTENSNSVLAELNFNLGVKQNEFKLYSAALSSIKKTIDLTPNESKYKEKYDDVKKHLDLSNRKNKKIGVTIVLVTLLGVLLIFSSIHFYNIFKENKEWEIAKKSNTIQSLQNYINDYYPGGKHVEDAIWMKTKLTNTIDSYKNYISISKNSKYINEVEEAIWDIAKSEKYLGIYESYASLYKNGKFIKEAEDSIWYHVKIANTFYLYKGYIDQFPNGKYINEAKSAQKKVGLKDKN